MNRLDPDLKRLLRLSREEASTASTDAPFGFAGRVVAGWQEASAEPAVQGLNRLFSTVAWTAAAVVAGCGLFLLQQAREPRLVSEFSTAAQFLAKTLAP
jgi:hypothetical protein